MRQYSDALEGAKTRKETTGESRTISGTFSDLAVRYYASTRFQSLRPTTMATYRGIIERFLVKFGHAKLKDFERRHFLQIMGEMSDRQAAANNMLRVIRQLLDYAVDLEFIKTNPADRIKGIPAKHPVFIPGQMKRLRFLKENMK